MKIWKLPWKLPQFYTVGPCVEVTSTEDSTEDNFHGSYHESNFHGSFHGSNFNGYPHESFHGSNFHKLP